MDMMVAGHGNISAEHLCAIIVSAGKELMVG